jgi:GntR family transcriptional regulator/MocR family aminotransferase
MLGQTPNPMNSRLREPLPSLTLNRRSGTPLYRQLYEAYRQAILSGQLRACAQLPSTRDLARELGISRNTAMYAFDQLLAEGYVRGEVGSGTFVESGLIAKEGLAVGMQSLVHPRVEFSREILRTSGVTQLAASLPAIPFRTGLPALDRFPLEVWSRVVARASRHASSRDLNYGEPQGDLHFRSTIADYLRHFRAVKCEPEQIFILSGSQQALHLVARMILSDGDPAWIEDPCYPGIRWVLLALGARTISVHVDDQGMEVERAIELHKAPKLIYVTPSHQFPLGVTMSLGRRLALLNYARKVGSWVVEDDYDSEFRFSGRPLSSLQGLSPECVIYIGTFSKSLFPALRLGYVVLPQQLVDAFSGFRRATDYCAPYLTQAAVNQFIIDGHFAHHLRHMRALYSERQSVMLSALRRHFGDHLWVKGADTGMNLVAWLPESVSGTRASQLASKQGLLTIPLSIFYSSPPPRDGLFLGFAAINRQRMKDGVETLAKALNDILSLHLSTAKKAVT